MDNEVLIKILERLSIIETQLKDIINLKDDVNSNTRNIIELKNKTENQQKEIDELKDGNKWLKRAVITSAFTLIVAGITALIKLM